MARGRIVAAIRAYFAAEDFIEVAAPILQISPGNEAHLHAFATEIVTTGGERERRYLHTSPEFAMKKLLAAGERRIFDLARVFRNREKGPLHAPEFTMLEWYRAEEPYEAVIGDTIAVIRAAAVSAGSVSLVFRGRQADPFAAPERTSVGEAFLRHAGIDLLATIGDRPDRDALAAAATEKGIRVAEDDSWSDVFSRVLSEKVEPQLGIGQITILHEYPLAEAALAKQSPRDSRVADRFEAYACGVELANGFNELTDAEEQRRRFIAEMDEKERVYGERYPIDETFLDALRTMPDAAGVALGLDRLVMLATGAPRIDLVQWDPALPKE
jgi:lysyl-tRNA synthetase class 2